MNIKHILIPFVFLACIVSSYVSARKLFAQAASKPSFSDFLKQMSSPEKPQKTNPRTIQQRTPVKKKKIKYEKASADLEQSIAQFLDSHIPPLAQGLSAIVKGKSAEETIKKKIEKRTTRIKKFESSKKTGSSRSSYRPSYGSSSYRPSSYTPSYNPYSSYSPSSYSSPYSGFSRPSYSSPYSGYGGSSYSPRSSYNNWDDDYSPSQSASSTSGNSNDNSSSRHSYGSNNSEKETDDKKKNKTIIQNIRTKFVQKLQEINQEAIKNPGQTTAKIITFAESIKKELETLKTAQSQLTEKDRVLIEKTPANTSIYTTFAPHLCNAFPAFLAKKELGAEGFQLILDELSDVVPKETLEKEGTAFITRFGKQQAQVVAEAEKKKDMQQLDKTIACLEEVKSSFPIAVSTMQEIEAVLKHAQDIKIKLMPSPVPTPPPAPPAP